MDKNKLRYAILKEIEQGNTALDEKDFEVSEKEFSNSVEFLMREKYMLGAAYGDGGWHLSIGAPKLTEKGENYLSENSALSKTYKGLKEVKKWLW